MQKNQPKPVILQAYCAKVHASPASLFSKTDVCNLLDDFYKSSYEQPTVSQALDLSQHFEKLSQLLQDEYEELVDFTSAEELVNFSSAEFSIDNGTELTLESIDLDRDALKNGFSNLVDNVFSSYKLAQNKNL